MKKLLHMWDRVEEGLSPTRLSAGGWELFTSMKGVGKASKALNAAMAKAKKDILKKLRSKEFKNLRPGSFEGRKDAQKIAAVLYDEGWKKHVRPVQNEFSDFGAADTEPNYHVRHGLAAIAAKYYKTDEGIFVDYL